MTLWSPPTSVELPVKGYLIHQQDVVKRWRTHRLGCKDNTESERDCVHSEIQSCELCVLRSVDGNVRLTGYEDGCGDPCPIAGSKTTSDNDAIVYYSMINQEKNSILLPEEFPKRRYSYSNSNRNIHRDFIGLTRSNASPVADEEERDPN